MFNVGELSWSWVPRKKYQSSKREREIRRRLFTFSVKHYIRHGKVVLLLVKTCCFFAVLVAVFWRSRCSCSSSPSWHLKLLNIRGIIETVAIILAMLSLCHIVWAGVVLRCIMGLFCGLSLLLLALKRLCKRLGQNSCHKTIQQWNSTQCGPSPALARNP